MKPIYRFDIEQGTDEWHEIKLGMFSATCAPDLLMDKKNKGYINLIDRIVEERITGSKCESMSFSGNFATERGNQYEPIARDDYELRELSVVKAVGVVIMDDWTLCSPDGLIGEDKLHQIKCPFFKTHKGYLKTKKIPTNYYKQMQFELMVTGRKQNIFTSYHPNLNPLDIVVERDEEMITELRKRLNEAIEEVKKEIELTKKLN